MANKQNQINNIVNRANT